MSSKALTLVDRQAGAGGWRLLRPWRELRVRTGCLRGLNFLWLEITRSCNLTCAHCYAGSAPNLPVVERMQLEDWCRVMDEARELGCRSLQFIGGEPTIHPHLVEMIEHARRAGFSECEVFTNATALRDEMLEAFAKNGVRVAFSFYAADAEAHDRITTNPGSFEKTVEGIRRLVARRIRLRAGLIALEENPRQLAAAKKFLRKNGVRSIGVDRVRGIGRGSALAAKARPMAELCGHCWRGKLCIDANGNAYPCVFSRFAPVGDFFADGVRGIVAGRELGVFRKQAYLGAEGG